MINFDIIIVFIVIVFILISLYKELIGPAFTFIIGIIALGFFGILTPSEIMSGFANEQLAVIVMLLLLGDIIRKASIIEIIFDRIFSKAKTYKRFMTQMMLVVAGFSAFLNNTPLVAVMMPYVNSWCKRKNVSPSKLMLPLSYAAILGGCITLIGTSTNLIVNGFVINQTIIPELESLNLFDFSYVGVPMLIIGILYMIFVGHKLLPTKSNEIESSSDTEKKYFFETEIRKDSLYIGKTIQESEVLEIKGLSIQKILRNDEIIINILPEILLKEGDVLIFTAETNAITSVLDLEKGLTIPSVGMLTHKVKTELVEIVISHNSSLINKSVKAANLRGKYDGAVLAIHRNKGEINNKFTNVKLKAGDVLLLLAGDDIEERSKDTLDFYFISKIKEIHKLELYKVIVLLGGTTLAILLSALGVIKLFMALISLLIVILGLKIASPKDLPKSIDYNLAIIIALSIALGSAMIKTGVAALIANMIISIFLPIGLLSLLFGIYLITSFLAAYVTNLAAVAITFPISLTMALNLGLDPHPFILVVSFAAAANFMTPIGYQTNLMVYGPGGYSFKDFFKVGFPLTILYMIVTVLILYYMFLM